MLLVTDLFAPPSTWSLKLVVLSSAVVTGTVKLVESSVASSAMMVMGEILRSANSEVGNIGLSHRRWDVSGEKLVVGWGSPSSKQMTDLPMALFSSCRYSCSGTSDTWIQGEGGGCGGGRRTSRVRSLSGMLLVLNDAVGMIFTSEYVSYF